MSHTRIRKFNTSQVYRGEQFDNDFCNAVVADNIVFPQSWAGNGQSGVSVPRPQLGPVDFTANRAVVTAPSLLSRCHAGGSV